VFKGIYAGNDSSGRIENISILGGRHNYLLVENAKHWSVGGFHWTSTNAYSTAVILGFGNGAQFCTVDAGQNECGAGAGIADAEHLACSGDANRIMVETMSYRGDSSGGVNKIQVLGTANQVYLGPWNSLGSAVFEKTSSGNDIRKWQTTDWSGSFS
jgi:hypothetical protein